MMQSEQEGDLYRQRRKDLGPEQRLILKTLREGGALVQRRCGGSHSWQLCGPAPEYGSVIYDVNNRWLQTLKQRKFLDKDLALTGEGEE